MYNHQENNLVVVTAPNWYMLLFKVKTNKEGLNKNDQYSGCPLEKSCIVTLSPDRLSLLLLRSHPIQLKYLWSDLSLPSATDILRYILSCRASAIYGTAD